MSDDEVQDYYDRYLYNVQLAERIETTLPGDANWACVVRFYAALHLLTAYLGKKSTVHFEPSSAVHADRWKAIRECTELRDAPSKYRELKDLSESVRYDPGFTYTPEHHQKVKAYLTKIIAIVEPKLKRLLGHS